MCKAIPSPVLKMIQNNILYSMFILFLPCLKVAQIPQRWKPEHLFFWSDVHSWLSLKIDNLPSFTYNVIYYMDTLNANITNVINLIILGKYYIHTCKSIHPSFPFFICYFVKCFKSL